jgi:hypothetical protein
VGEGALVAGAGLVFAGAFVGALVAGLAVVGEASVGKAGVGDVGAGVLAVVAQPTANASSAVKNRAERNRFCDIWSPFHDFQATHLWTGIKIEFKFH